MPFLLPQSLAVITVSSKKMRLCRGSHLFPCSEQDGDIGGCSRAAGNIETRSPPSTPFISEDDHTGGGFRTPSECLRRPFAEQTPGTKTFGRAAGQPQTIGQNYFIALKKAQGDRTMPQFEKLMPPLRRLLKT